MGAENTALRCGGCGQPLDNPAQYHPVECCVSFKAGMKEETNCHIIAKSREEARRAGIREAVNRVEQLWKPQHHNLCYGIIEPHPDCACCKWQVWKGEWGVE